MEHYKVSTYGMEALNFGAVLRLLCVTFKDGLFITGHEGTVIVVNRATEKRVDFDISKIQGRNVREIVTAGFYDKSVALEVLEKKQPAFQFSGIMIVSVSFL